MEPRGEVSMFWGCVTLLAHHCVSQIMKLTHTLVPRVFKGASLYRHDGLNPRLQNCIYSPAPPSSEVGLISDGSRPQPSNHIAVFLAWPALVLSHLISIKSGVV